MSHKMITVILILLVSLIFLALLVLTYRNWKVNNNPLQKQFLAGALPSPLPDGFYRGNAHGIKTNWQGKKFTSSSATGINIFKNESKESESFPFKTYVGPGISDKHLQVLKIDYSELTKPWWVRFVLDEVVEIEPNHYLGKITLNFIKGWPFSVGWFELRKE